MKTPTPKFNPAAPDRISDGEWAEAYRVNRMTLNGWRREGAPITDPDEMLSWLWNRTNTPERFLREMRDRLEEILRAMKDGPISAWTGEDCDQRSAGDVIFHAEELAEELRKYRGNSPEVARVTEAIDALKSAFLAVGWNGRVARY